MFLAFSKFPRFICSAVTFISVLLIFLTPLAQASEPEKQTHQHELHQESAKTASHAHENMIEHEHEHEHEVILVRSTRFARSASDEPIRVELINQEELMEKAMMRPGNISMLVAETGGVRVQTTSPALGSANIRLQGLYGRYTQLLNDGLAIYGGQAASIGLLQIPPTDLAGVEIIKGSASSLYGGSAMGGVINLISRRPTDDPEAEVLLNFTSRDGQDLTSYFASPISNEFSASFTAGAHHQGDQDLDDDGWIDMAGYERYTARPRLFWEGQNGVNVYATAGVMNERRQGGTRTGRLVPDGNPFAQNQDSERFDSGITIDGPLSETMSWTVRGSAMQQNHDKQFGALIENDAHESYLVEGSVSGYNDTTQWVVGLAMQSERFESEQYSTFNYRYDVPGVFAQADYEWTQDISTSLSMRFDDHSEFGNQFSPRLSLLYSPADWAIRASHGKGYFAPTPFVEEIEAAGLARLSQISQLEEETATTSSLDITYQFEKLEAGLTIFASEVEGVTELQAFSSQNNLELDSVRLVNAMSASRIKGSEVSLRYKWHDFKLMASYLYLNTSEFDSGSLQRRPIELTPEHSAGFVAMWEQHGKGRVGFEAYYTGIQSLYGNPFREESEAYWHLGLLGEITLGRYSWFINAENLLNIRQTRDDSLVLPFRAPDGQWTTDIWSRNDGFIVNAGVRISFGHH